MADVGAVGGGFTTAASWQTIDATSLLDSEAASTAISTSNLDSSTFVLPATAVDGVYIKFNGRAASPAGTFTVSIRNSTSPGTRDGSVTVNVSDLNVAGNGWAFFKISSFTPNGTDSYLIRLVCSNTGSQVTVFRNGTSNNWSRRIRTTTTQAPASGNHLVVANELTGAGTNNAVTITMDNTATTSWGPTVSGGPPQGVVVSQGGTMTWGTTASTAYYFKWKGIFLVCGGGTVNCGASGGGAMPSTSSAVFEMDTVASGDSYMKIDAGGTITAYGAVKTTQTVMMADAAAAATNLTVGDTTGWLNNDRLGFTPTGNSASHYETKLVSSVGSSTTVTLTAGLTNAHSGTNTLPTGIRGYVVNLTRNILFKSVSTTNLGQFYVPPAGGTVNLNYVEFDGTTLGNGQTSNVIVNLRMTTNSVSLVKCSINGGASGAGGNKKGLHLPDAACNNFTFNDVVMWDIPGAHINIPTNLSGAAWTITNCFSCKNSDSIGMWYLQAINSGGTITNNKLFCANGTGRGALELDNNATVGGWANLSSTFFTDNEAWYSLYYGFLIGNTSNNGGAALYMKNCKAYRNGISAGGPGLFVQGAATKFILDTCDFMGNGPSGNSQILFGGGGYCQMYDCTLSGDSTVAAFVGIATSAGDLTVNMYNCTLGVATGIRVAHASADLQIVKPGQATMQVWANKCNFASSTVFSNLTSASFQTQFGDHVDGGGSFLRSQDHGQVAGTHKTFAPQGTISIEATVFGAAAPSEKLTPSNATYKLRSCVALIPVDSGVAKTVNVVVRKSLASSGDSADYNGNQPRLVVRRNDALGITADTVLDTMAAALGTPETLSGTTVAVSEDGVLECFVDLDGTAGFATLDDWS